MNLTYQNEKDRNIEKKYQGCLGKMVNLFELNIGVPSNKRITDKPHQDGSTSSRRISLDLVTNCGDQFETKVVVSDRKPHITPVKMLMDQEMSKEAQSKQSPPNLVAKLMGLDSLPLREDHDRGWQRAHTRSRSVIPVSEYEQDGRFFEYKVDDEKMALVRQKFAEAKLLSADEKHRNSKKLQDALEVLNSNKDLFLKCLQEPSPLLHNNHGESFAPPPCTETKRITVLRPSKLAEEDGNKNGKHNKNGSNPSQPTRIVVLKPKSHIYDTKSEGCIGDVEDNDDDERHEVREVAKAITIQMREKLGRFYHKEEEAMDSSLFSKGYVGDDSSFNRSEFEYSEVASPISRHSWDCVNRHGCSPYSPSALSRASYSSESSVSREAKKRLSERWALMSTTNENPRELRTFQRSSSTLGEMLSLSEVKKAAATKSEGESVGLEHDKDSNPRLVNGLRVDDEIACGSPRNLIRSKSLPVSSAPKEETKVASSKSSLRAKVSNLLFSRNRKPGKDKDKDKSLGSVPKDESQTVSREKPPVHSSPSSEETSGAVASLSDHIGRKDVTTCSEDQPSPVSVLDASFEEDDHHTPKVFPRCELPDKHGSFPLNLIGSKSIDKSPPIGSIARTLSWDEDTSYPVKDSATTIQESEADKQEWIIYVETLLSGLKVEGRVDPYSPDSPLDPSLRAKHIDPKDNETLTEAKKRQKRSIQKLMFDYVNATLIDNDNKGSDLLDKVRSRVNAWLSGDIVPLSGNFGEDCVMAVEGVVREELGGRGWANGLRHETGSLGIEIEGKLIEELVLEVVLEMTG